MHRALIALGVAFALAATVPPARADEPEVEVGTPAPEPAAEPTPAAAEPSEPAAAATSADAAAETPITAEPIEAVHRPPGAWAALAIAADLLVMRPIGLVSLAAGSAAFVAVAPVAAATCTLGDRADALRDRAANVFTRPLGAL
jgi:hypothetical protein